MRPPRTAALLVLTALMLAGCGIDEEVAAELEATVQAFDPPAVWDETDHGDGPYADDGFPLVYGDVLCSRDECLHAVRRWLLADDGAVDLGALDAALAAVPGWELAYAPDCELGRRATDTTLIDQSGCVWEADVGDRYVLLRLHRSGDNAPWSLRASAQLDSHHRRASDSPVVALMRRDAATPLLAVADRVQPPASWRLIQDTVTAEPDDCDEPDCLTVLRTWFDVEQLTADQLAALLADAGLRVGATEGSCVRDPDADRPHVTCTAAATGDGVEARLEATAVGDVHEVDLTVTAAD